MSKISRRRLAQATLRLINERPTERAKILRSVAAYLVDHKQAGQVELLVGDIARELEIQSGHLFAEVQSAFALDDQTRQSLKTYLQNQTGAKTVELSEQVDPSLLAGIVVRTPNEELDTSAKRKLTRLVSTHFALGRNARQQRGTDRAVHKYGEGSTGVVNAAGRQEPISKGGLSSADAVGGAESVAGINFGGNT